jgi:hypothetical protein
VKFSRSWLDKLTTNGTRPVRPEPVEGRLPDSWLLDLKSFQTRSHPQVISDAGKTSHDTAPEMFWKC